MLYEQGGGPGAITRTVIHIVPSDPAANSPVAPQVYVPGVPPVPPAPEVAIVVALLSVQEPVPEPLPVAGNVAVTPIAATRIVRFCTAPPRASAAMQGVRRLDTAPEGVDFRGAGLCNGAACDAVGVPGYRTPLRVPPARLLPVHWRASWRPAASGLPAQPAHPQRGERLSHGPLPVSAVRNPATGANYHSKFIGGGNPQ